MKIRSLIIPALIYVSSATHAYAMSYYVINSGNGNVEAYNVQNGAIGNSIYSGMLRTDPLDPRSNYPIQIGLNKTNNTINIDGVHTVTPNTNLFNVGGILDITSANIQSFSPGAYTGGLFVKTIVGNYVINSGNGNAEAYNVQNGAIGNSIYSGMLRTDSLDPRSNYPIQIGLNGTNNTINIDGVHTITPNTNLFNVDDILDITSANIQSFSPGAYTGGLFVKTIVGNYVINSGNGNVEAYNVQNGAIGNSIYSGMLRTDPLDPRSNYPIQIGLNGTNNTINIDGVHTITPNTNLFKVDDILDITSADIESFSPGFYTGGIFVTVRDNNNNIPEPASILLVGVGLAGFGLSHRRKGRQRSVSLH